MDRREGTLGSRAVRWAVPILAVAMAAAALPEAAMPEAAVAQVPSETGACWASIEPASFSDTVGLSEESLAAIDCVAHYGVTRGTTATTYSPEAEVTRSQMALFLVRTASALELEVPDGSSEPFDDVDSLDVERRRAVVQLHELGITRGVARRVFGPNRSVTRSHMAQFLLRLLRLTDVPLPEPATGGFDDLGGLAATAREAIAVMAELGIMDAAEAGRFDPRAAVTREDMARLLARTLEAAGARPVRLELSLSSVSVLLGGSAEATVRALKPTGDPYPGLLIDVFAAYGLSPGGSCRLDTGAKVNGGDAGTSQNCRIDRGDPRTDAAGEVRVGLAHSARPVLNWIYAWAGDDGREFDDDEIQTQARVRIGWQPPPTGVTITALDRAVFRKSVTVAARLVGGSFSGRRMVLAAGAAGGPVRALRVGTTNRAGRVSFNLPGLLEPAEDHHRSLPVAETVLVFWDRNGNSVHDGPAELSAQTVLTWRRA